VKDYLYVVTITGSEGKKAMVMNLIEKDDDEAASRYVRTSGEKIAENTAAGLVEDGEVQFQRATARHECYRLVRIPT